MRKVFVLILMFSICSFQSTKFNKTKINKQISILIPINFIPVPQDEMSSKFISYRAPLAAYTNETAEIDFGVNMATSIWRDTDVELMRSFYKSNIINLYDEVNFIRNEVKIINKRKFVVFEYISTINPDKRSAILDPPVEKYTYIQYSIIRGRVYLFDFSSPASQKEIWEPIVQKVMESVKIK